MRNSPLRILVIEDDEDTCCNLRDILELDGYTVEAASTAADALSRGRLAQTNVVLLDRRLPDGTAEKLLPELQAQAPDTDVIIITGHADMDSAIAALRLGAIDYLLKPIKPEILRASLGRLAERRRLAERLVEAERLAAIGEAMAGLTHESRNALARSQANLRRLARRLRNRPDLLELIEAALGAQHDIQRLFEDVRQYAAPLNLRHEPTDLVQLLREAWARLALERKGRDAQLRDNYSAPDHICAIDRFSMGNVFRNILENALAACTDPVKIDVTFSGTQLGDAPAFQVAIRDNGPGFPPETVPRAFDPFHTTKTHGTGLGLAIVKRTVEEHGGRVAIGSAAESGAEVLITLPRAHS
jgi:signal transduction histidine kinase